MFNSVFLFIMLLAFKHTHLISDLDVFPCIPLHLVSSCTFRAASRKPWPPGQIWPANLIQLARVGMLSTLIFLVMSAK